MNCAHPWVILSHVVVESNASCAAFLDNREFVFQLTPLTYLGYFALTNLIELPFVYLATGKQKRSAVLTALVLNLATHPLICFYFVNHTRGRSFGEFTLLAEAFAFSTEMLIIALIFRKRASAAAAWVFLANLVSWTVGSFL